VTGNTLGETVKIVQGLARLLVDAARDLLPIVVVIAFFQIVVIRQPFPNLGDVLIGTLLVVLGLAFFVRGLEMGLFPLGEAMAQAFAKKGSALWLMGVCLCLGLWHDGGGTGTHRGGCRGGAHGG